MFSTLIRLGLTVSGAALLASCGGSSVAETQQSTPEGLFLGTNTVTLTDPSAPVSAPTTITCSESMLTFVVVNDSIYTFYYTGTAKQPIVTTASEGSLTFSNGTMGATDIDEVNLPNPVANTGCSGTINGVATSNIAVTSPSKVVYSSTNVPANGPNLTGAYNTGQNIAGTFTYPFDYPVTYTDAANTTPVPLATSNLTTFNLNYDTDYQGVQDLSTLAGTYIGTVGSSQQSEQATFTIGTASVPANSGNQFGVSIVTGTGASGCTYTGSASPLFKGNGYTFIVTSGGSPCNLPNTQFTGIAYLDVANKFLYSFAPDTARTDGLIFTGAKQ